MKIIYKLLFKLIPVSLQKRMGKSSFLKPLRDLVLRPTGKFKVSYVDIEKKYLEYETKFRFFAAVKIALKAKERGIENTLLRNTIALLKKHKTHTDDCIVLDVGTNFGYLSMVWGLSVCRNGAVHGFEVNTNVFDTFKRTIDYNSMNNIVLNYNAVGDKKDTVKIYDMDTTSNVIDTDNSAKFDLVEMITLDSYMLDKDLKRCDLVKIDVDGIEFEILSGSLKLLKTLKPIFVIETNDDKRIIDFFVENDYHVLDMKLNPFSGSTNLPPNIFCVPKTL